MAIRYSPQDRIGFHLCGNRSRGSACQPERGGYAAQWPTGGEAQRPLPLTLLSSQELQPGTVGIYGFIGAEVADWHRVMTFSSMFAVPILILFLVLQNKIVSGITAGALK